MLFFQKLSMIHIYFKIFNLFPLFDPNILSLILLQCKIINIKNIHLEQKTKKKNVVILIYCV